MIHLDRAKLPPPPAGHPPVCCRTLHPFPFIFTAWSTIRGVALYQTHVNLSFQLQDTSPVRWQTLHAAFIYFYMRSQSGSQSNNFMGGKQISHSNPTFHNLSSTLTQIAAPRPSDPLAGFAHAFRPHLLIYACIFTWGVGSDGIHYGDWG